MKRFLLFLAFAALCGWCLAAADGEPGFADWRGYRRISFPFEGRPGFVVEPKIAAPGRPWVWRTSFPDYHPEVDLELLHSGYHVAFIDCVEMLGCDEALEIMSRFREAIRQRWKLAEKCALEAVSRGGLHAYRYAARYPRQVACLYADTPVMNLASWPLRWKESARQVEEALRYYRLKDRRELESYRGNPIDLLEPIARDKIPLRHVISLNDRVVPPEDNTLEAQRRLRKLGHDIELVRVAEGTGESYGHHFSLPEVFRTSRFIMRHSYVLPGATEYFRLRSGLGNSMDRFLRQKTGRVVFLGGSITYNPGWREEVMRYLRLRFPETEFDFIAAGIPSLGSVPHSFRLQKDVLMKGPVDLLFVEAAVNDHNYDTWPERADYALRGMEGVVRHLRRIHPMTDVVEMHFVHDGAHLPEFRAGRVPYTVAAHEKVAEFYGCPSLNLSREVFDRMEAGEFTWAGDFKNLHPSPYGQRVYANSITRMLDAAFASAGGRPRAHPVPKKALDARSYADGRTGVLAEARIIRGFRRDERWNPKDGRATRAGFVEVPALTGGAPGDEFEFDFKGSACGLLIASGYNSAVVETSVDRGPYRKIDTFTPWSKSLYLPWAVILADGLKPGRHTVAVRISGEVPGRTALHVLRLLLN